MKKSIFLTMAAIAFLGTFVSLSLTACEKEVNKGKVENSKSVLPYENQFFWCKISTDTSELYIKILDDIDSVHLVEWRYIENDVFIIDQYAAMLCTDIDNTSIINYTDSCFSIENDGFVLNIRNIETNDSVSSADIYWEGHYAHLEVPAVDSLGLMALAAHLVSDSKGIKPPWGYPANPWSWAVLVIRGVKWLWDQMPPKCQEMYKEAAKCQLRGCTPIYDFVNCSCKCRKYLGTPYECNCDD